MTAAYSMEQVISADGTPITYRKFGRGCSAALLLHGGMQASQNFTRLAHALASGGSGRSVFVPNRRGRGGSGPFGPQYGLQRECEDVEALLDATGARFVFGLSSGAVIAAYAASRLAAIDRLALYEPPLPFEASPTAWLPRYERDLAAGDLASAMVTVIQGTGPESLFWKLPRGLLAPVFRRAIAADARSTEADYVHIADLIPTMRYDAQLVNEMKGHIQALTAIRAKVLLLGGEKSVRSLRHGLDSLARLLPGAERLEFPGAGHRAADNRGIPERVAQELSRFFG
jgi:pimeloyl-ACP methyl ester carboxylesterase